VQLNLLSKQNQLHLVYQRGLTCACLADIEFSGLRLDKEAVLEEHRKISKEYLETKAELETYGNINWRSPKQVAKFLYDSLKFGEPLDRRGNPARTATGNRSASKETIAALVPRNDEQAAFLEHFKKVANLNARLTKTLDFLKGVCEHYDSTFYGILNQGTTSSHRLSSSGRPILLPTPEGKLEKKQVQFQNLPREYKRLIKAKRDGWLVLEADESQLEFRAAAQLGHDSIATAEISAGVDIHSITAETLTRAGEKTSRQDAKSRTFRPLYGGKSGTKAEAAYCKFFQEKYNQIYKTQEGWTWEVLKTGKLVTPYGMIFYWPGTRISSTGYIDNTTTIFNLPVQGFATAEVVPLALVAFWHRTKDLELEITNTVHDSIVAEVSPKDAELSSKIAVQCMTTDVYDLLMKLYKYEWTVPLAAEIKIGERWGEASLHK
jgi:DNA polymerase I-like protein with 3'-5' exonuclease and polymerase domains